MNYSVDQIVKIIDDKRFYKFNNSNKEKLSQITETLDEKYKIIMNLVINHRTEDLQKFVDANLKWDLIAGFGGLHYIINNFNEEWYTPNKLEDLSDFYIYTKLLHNIIRNELPLTYEFLNHYNYLVDEDNNLFWELIVKGFTSEKINKGYLKAFLQYNEIKQFSIPDDCYPNDEEWNYTYARARLSEYSWEKFEKEYEISELIEFITGEDSYLPMLISEVFDELDIENQIKFINKLKDNFDERTLFAVIKNSSNEYFLDYIWNDDFVKRNLIYLEDSGAIKRIFLKKLFEKHPDMRDEIIILMLTFNNDNNYQDYNYQGVTVEEIIELIKKLVEKID